MVMNNGFITSGQTARHKLLLTAHVSPFYQNHFNWLSLFLAEDDQTGVKVVTYTEPILVAVTFKLHAAWSAQLSSVLVLLDLSVAYGHIPDSCSSLQSWEILFKNESKLLSDWSVRLESDIDQVYTGSMLIHHRSPTRLCPRSPFVVLLYPIISFLYKDIFLHVFQSTAMLMILISE